MSRTERDQQNLRIGFVSDGVYPFNKGGKERRLWEVSRRLRGMGYEVHIYTMNWWNGPNRIELDDVHFHAICKFRPLYDGERRSIIQAIVFGLAALKLVTAEFDVLDVDHMPYFPIFTSRLVCALRRKRMVTTWHEVWGSEYWRSYLGRLAPISSAIEFLAARASKEIVSVSAQTSMRLLDELKVSSVIHTIGLGVDLDAVQEERNAKLYADILYAGRLLSHKNVDMLIRAIARIRDTNPAISCRIVGEGPERARLESIASELGLECNVSFHDFYPGAEIYGVMKSAAVFALPSTREGFGAVVLEANSCGLPVVTVDHPDNAARHLIVEGQNGFLADLNEVSLAEALTLALKSSPLMDPRLSAERSGRLRDWDQVTADVAQALVGERLASANRPVCAPIRRPVLSQDDPS